jgi:imidazolonepropionase-like amidohydrolase
VHGFPGFSLHQELALFVQAGLTPLQALQTATLNPAKFMNRLADLGTVERGKLADLILLDANPLDDIANTKKIRAVVIAGRYLDRTELDRMLSGVERAAAAHGSAQ